MALALGALREIETHSVALPTVRSATIDDAEAIARIVVRAWQFAYKGHVPDDYLDRLDVVERERKWRGDIGEGVRTILVSEVGGTVVGFCSVAASDAGPDDRRIGEITAIYVDPDQIRTGHGRALISKAKSLAGEAGVESLILWVLETNVRARAFYSAMGFEPDGAQKIDRRPGFDLREVRYRVSIDPRS